MRDEGAPHWLPELIGCDWNRYEESLKIAYGIFWRDFGHQHRRPAFRGKRMELKRHPKFEGKSATFWHFVTEGGDEPQRTPVRERLERIAWPKAMIVEAERIPSRVMVWQNERSRRNHRRASRWVIALSDFSYVVVIDEREDFVLPWTAYPVEENHRRRKLRKEYDAWKARKG